MPGVGWQKSTRTIVTIMKKLLPIVVAFAIVAVMVSVKVKRRPAEPEAPEGAWEPVNGEPSQ